MNREASLFSRSSLRTLRPPFHESIRLNTRCLSQTAQAPLGQGASPAHPAHYWLPSVPCPGLGGCRFLEPPALRWRSLPIRWRDQSVIFWDIAPTGDGKKTSTPTGLNAPTQACQPQVLEDTWLRTQLNTKWSRGPTPLLNTAMPRSPGRPSSDRRARQRRPSASPQCCRCRRSPAPRGPRSKVLG